MKLICPDCGSDRVAKYGEKSVIDGKRFYRCDAYQLEMGPLRSRFKLWALTLTASALAVAIPVANIYLERPAIYTAAPLLAAFAMAGFREIRKPQPLGTNIVATCVN